MVTRKNNVVKTNIILMDLVKGHLIPHITRDSTNEKYAMSIYMYHSGNASHKLLLDNKHTHTHISDIDTMISYLMKIT